MTGEFKSAVCIFKININNLNLLQEFFELTTDVVVTSSFSFARYFFYDQKERRKAYVLAAKFRAFLLSEDAARQPLGTSYVPSPPLHGYISISSHIYPLLTSSSRFHAYQVFFFTWIFGPSAKRHFNASSIRDKNVPAKNRRGKKTRTRNLQYGPRRLGK